MFVKTFLLMKMYETVTVWVKVKAYSTIQLIDSIQSHLVLRDPRRLAPVQVNLFLHCKGLKRYEAGYHVYTVNKQVTLKYSMI